MSFPTLQPSTWSCSIFGPQLVEALVATGLVYLIFEATKARWSKVAQLLQKDLPGLMHIPEVSGCETRGLKKNVGSISTFPLKMGSSSKLLLFRRGGLAATFPRLANSTPRCMGVRSALCGLSRRFSMSQSGESVDSGSWIGTGTLGLLVVDDGR